MSESRKLEHLIIAVRTAEASIYDGGLLGALRYAATKIVLSVNEKKA